MSFLARATIDTSYRIAMSTKPVLKQRDVNVIVPDPNANRKKVGFSAKEKQVQGFSSKTAPTAMLDIDDICGKRTELVVTLNVRSRVDAPVKSRNIIEEEIVWDASDQYSSGFSLGHLTHEVKVGRDTEHMTSEELRKELKHFGLDSKGTRQELKDRLEEHLCEQAVEAPKTKRKGSKNRSKDAKLRM